MTWQIVLKGIIHPHYVKTNDKTTALMTFCKEAVFTTVVWLYCESKTDMTFHFSITYILGCQIFLQNKLWRSNNLKRPRKKSWLWRCFSFKKFPFFQKIGPKIKKIMQNWTRNLLDLFFFLFFSHLAILGGRLPAKSQITMFGVGFISLISGFCSRHFITMKTKTNPFQKRMNQPLISNLCHAIVHLISRSRALEIYMCM